MRVVGTSVMVSAYFRGGVQGRVHDLLVYEQVRVLVTASTLAELQTVLVRPGFLVYLRKTG